MKAISTKHVCNIMPHSSHLFGNEKLALHSLLNLILSLIHLHLLVYTDWHYKYISKALAATSRTASGTDSLLN